MSSSLDCMRPLMGFKQKKRKRKDFQERKKPVQVGILGETYCLEAVRTLNSSSSSLPSIPLDILEMMQPRLDSSSLKETERDFEFLILLYPPVTSWNYKCEPLIQVFAVLELKRRSLCNEASTLPAKLCSQSRQPPEASQTHCSSLRLSHYF